MGDGNGFDIATDMDALKTKNKNTNYWGDILSVFTQCISKRRASNRASSREARQLIDNIDNTNEDDEEIIYDISGFISELTSEKNNCN